MQQKGAVPAYLIFVIFYTDQIYTQKPQMKTKRIGRQSCKNDALLGKTKICVKKLHTKCRTKHWVQNYTLSVKRLIKQIV